MCLYAAKPSVNCEKKTIFPEHPVYSLVIGGRPGHGLRDQFRKNKITNNAFLSAGSTLLPISEYSEIPSHLAPYP